MPAVNHFILRVEMCHHEGEVVVTVPRDEQEFGSPCDQGDPDRRLWTVNLMKFARFELIATVTVASNRSRSVCEDISTSASYHHNDLDGVYVNGKGCHFPRVEHQ